MKPGCSVIHSSNMMHPCKWAIGDMLSGKKYPSNSGPKHIEENKKTEFQIVYEK